MKLKAKLAQLSGRGLALAHEAAEPVLPGATKQSDASDVVGLPDVAKAREAAAALPASRNVQLRARIDALRRAKPGQAASLAPAADWQSCVVQTPFGPLCQIITQHAPSFVQGATPVAPCLSVSGAQMSALALDAELEAVDCRRLLFVDTETTGLAGGAGTVPFLIGVAYFVDGALCVEQWVLRRLGEEAPMLERLASLLAKADAIVTYNGKSYDWPLLRTRFILNRVKMPSLRPHLDLLHCARRLFKRRAPEGAEAKRGGLKLAEVERAFLGFRRVGDIDGAHIPERYFSYLRGASAALLEPVLEHNRHDLVSLAALLGLAGRKLEAPGQNQSADEHLNLAHIAWRGQHTERALAFAEHAAASDAAHIRGEAALLLAHMFLRQRKYLQTRAALQAGLTQVHAASMLQSTLHLALAKLLEHRLSDVPGALVHAAYTHRAEGAQAHAKRTARLLRKAARIAQHRRPGHSGAAHPLPNTSPAP